MRPILVLACAATLLGSARAQEPPPELAFVPPDALAFAHVRVAQLFSDPSTARSKALLLKRIPKEVLAFNSQFQPSPMTYERVTAFVVAGPTREANAPLTFDSVGVVVRTSAPFDAKLVAAGFGAGAVGKQLHGRPVLVDDTDHALCILDDRTVLLGHADAVGASLAPRPAGGGHQLAESLAAAAKGHALTVGARDGVSGFFGPPSAMRGLSDPNPLEGAVSLLATYDLGAEPAWFSTTRFADEAKAKAAVERFGANAKSARELLEPRRDEARKQITGADLPPAPRDLRQQGRAADGLAALALIEWFDAVLEDPPFRRVGDRVEVAYAVHPLAARLSAPVLVYAAFALPSAALGAQPFQFPGLYAPRPTVVDNNFKQIGLAIHNYESAYGYFPPADGVARPGQPRHSWRVMVLPYIEEEKLYQKFKLDEPFDSPHNLKVVADNPMPKLFELPGVTKPGEKLTHYQAFTGAGTIFAPGKPRSIVSISDGTSNTLMATLAAKPVPWNQPDDIAFDPNLDMRTRLLQLAPNGKPVAENGRFRVLFADGSVAGLNGTIAPDVLKSAITADGGEVVDLDSAKK